MTLNDPLANVLSHILIEEKKGRTSVEVKPNTRVIRKVLGIFHDNKYLGELKNNDSSKGGSITINLLGAINKTGVIKPRFSVKASEYRKFEKRFLPAHGFGFLIVSTNKGIMTHEDAQEKNLGGKLLAYVY